MDCRMNLNNLTSVYLDFQRDRKIQAKETMNEQTKTLNRSWLEFSKQRKKHQPHKFKKVKRKPSWINTNRTHTDTHVDTYYILST